MESSLVNKLGVNSCRFDTPHHTKRALFVQVPENPSNRNAPLENIIELRFVNWSTLEINILHFVGMEPIWVAVS